MSYSSYGNGSFQSLTCLSHSLGQQVRHHSSPSCSLGSQTQTHGYRNKSANSQSLPQHCKKSLQKTQCHAATPQEQSSRYVEALDHLSTKLKIPLSAVEPTNALEDDGLVPGICRLFLEGSCRQGSRCHQVHAKRDVVEALRSEALEMPSCCHLHGGLCSYEGLPFNLTVTIGGRTLGLHSLTPTNFLWKLYREHGENNLVVPRARICRGHRRGLCRFGEECSFLHACREVVFDGEESIGGTPMSASRAPCNGNSLDAYANGAGAHRNENGGNDVEDGLSALSFNASSFNGVGNAGLNSGIAPRENSFSEMGWPTGAESGSFSGTSRSRHSLSYRMSQSVNVESSKEFKAPLLRPLRPAQRGTLSNQRHNPYGDAISFQ